jgi:hypothetical protein
MLRTCSPARSCRVCILHQLATDNPSIDRLYAWLKNTLSLFGYVGFEAELYRFVERMKK